MNIINATSAPITFLSKNGVEENEQKELTVTAEAAQVIRTIEPMETKIPVVVETGSEVKGHIEDIPVEQVIYGDIHGLPKQVADIIYVVTPDVAAAAFRAGRSDCFSPGGVVTNNRGKIVGYLSLQKL